MSLFKFGPYNLLYTMKINANQLLFLFILGIGMQSEQKLTRARFRQ